MNIDWDGFADLVKLQHYRLGGFAMTRDEWKEAFIDALLTNSNADQSEADFEAEREIECQMVDHGQDPQEWEPARHCAMRVMQEWIDDAEDDDGDVDL